MEYCHAKSCDPPDARACGGKECCFFLANGPCEYFRAEKQETPVRDMPPPFPRAADVLA